MARPSQASSPKSGPAPVSIPAVKPQKLYFPSELEPLNRIILNRRGKGIPIGTLTAIFGAPKAGKSTLAAQLALEYAMAHDGNVAIHDTEVNQHVISDLMDRLAERFGEQVNVVFVTATAKKTKTSREERENGAEDVKYETVFELRNEIVPGITNAFIIQCPEMALVTHLYGHGMDILVSDGGKVTADLLKGGWITDPGDIPLGKFFKEHNVKSFVLDSVTNPLDKIPAVTKNFPGRSDITQAWLIQIINLAWHFEIPTFVIAHESRNEASIGSQMLDIEGGKGVDYNVKHVLYLLNKNSQGLLPGAVDRKKMEKTVPDSARRLFGARIPGRPDWSGPETLDLTETGFVAFQ